MPADPSFPTRYRQRWQARHFYGEDADRYASFYAKTDVLGDRLADWLSHRGNDGRSAFENALRHGTSAGDPSALREFIADVERVPDWVDFEQINDGALAYQRFGVVGMIVLGARALLNGYHSSAAVKPLMMTGELTQNVQPRLARTARFVSDATQRHGLRQGNPGWETSVRVRLIHAYVRRQCLASPEWRTDEWGLPVNQADLFGTLLEFSLLMMEGVRALGFDLTEAEANAILALWRYEGHLSGVDPWLLEHLENEAATQRIGELIHMVQPGPDEDSIALANALLGVPGENSPQNVPPALARALIRFHNGLARALNPPEIADDLGLPDDLWKYAHVPTRALVRPFEIARKRLPGGDRLAAWLGNGVIRRDLDRQQRMLAARQRKAS